MSVLISCIIGSCTLRCALDVVGPVKEECTLSLHRYYVVNYLGASHTLVSCISSASWLEIDHFELTPTVEITAFCCTVGKLVVALVTHEGQMHHGQV